MSINLIYIVIYLISFLLAACATKFFYDAKNGALRWHMVGLFSVLAWKCLWNAIIATCNWLEIADRIGRVHIFEIIATVPLLVVLILIVFFLYRSYKSR